MLYIQGLTLDITCGHTKLSQSLWTEQNTHEHSRLSSIGWWWIYNYSWLFQVIQSVSYPSIRCTPKENHIKFTQVYSFFFPWDLSFVCWSTSACLASSSKAHTSAGKLKNIQHLLKSFCFWNAARKSIICWRCIMNYCTWLILVTLCQAAPP